MFRPKEIIRESYWADVSITLEESAYDPVSKLVSGNSLQGRIAVSDILGSRYYLPVGIAGPGWFMKVYMMRFR